MEWDEIKTMIISDSWMWALQEQEEKREQPNKEVFDTYWVDLGGEG